MPDKDINIHVTAKGAEQAKQGLDGVAAATEKVGQTTTDASGRVRDAHGRFVKGTGQAAEATDKLGAATDKAATKLASMAAGYVSIAALIAAATKALRAQTEALEENARVAAKHQNTLLRLQFLGDYYKDKPELRKEIAALAEFGRRPFEEVADAAYNLRSKNAGMTEAQRMGIMRETLEMGRTDPSLPLNTLADMFSLYQKQSGITDANRVQNVLQKTIEEAGGSGADVAAYMPRFLPIGMAGGLSGSQSAGLWAYGTTLESEASVATTGLRAIMMGLQGKGTPEGAKLLEKMGITQDMSFFEKMNILSGQNIDLATAEQLFQREGAAMGLNMLKDPAAMMRSINSVTAADRGDIDLTKNKIEGLFGTDAVAKMEEDTRMLEVQIENIRANDARALKGKYLLLQAEKQMREEGTPEWWIQTNLAMMRGEMAIGLSPETAFQMGTTETQRTIINQNQNVIFNAPEKGPSPVIPNDLN
ncbi:MAG: phage tail tape measure protein [Patescibacteria group bacterium]